MIEYFEDYGMLKWLDPNDYRKGKWRYVGYAIATDDEEYDIVENDNEYRFTRV